MQKQAQVALKDTKLHVDDINKMLEYLKVDLDNTKDEFSKTKDDHKLVIQALQQQHQKDTDRTQKDHEVEVKALQQESSEQQKNHKSEVQQLRQKMIDTQQETDKKQKEKQLSIDKLEEEVKSIQVEGIDKDTKIKQLKKSYDFLVGHPLALINGLE